MCALEKYVYIVGGFENGENKLRSCERFSID